MLAKNAIKKLEKFGFDVRLEKNNLVEAWKDEHRISFWIQDEEVCVIKSDENWSRKERYIMTDYFPETFHDNIKQAIEFVEWKHQRKGA